MSSVEVFEVFPDDKEANLFVAKCDVNDLKRFLRGQMTIDERMMLCSANNEFMNRRFNELLECIIDENYQHPQVEDFTVPSYLLIESENKEWGFYYSHANIMRILIHEDVDDDRYYPELFLHYEYIKEHFKYYANHNRLNCEWENSDLYIDIVKQVHANPRWIVNYLGEYDTFTSDTLASYHKYLVDQYNRLRSIYKLPEIHKFTLYKDLMDELCGCILAYKGRSIMWDKYQIEYKAKKETKEQMAIRIKKENDMKCICEVPDDPELATLLINKFCEIYIEELRGYYADDDRRFEFEYPHFGGVVYFKLLLEWFIASYGGKFICKLVESNLILDCYNLVPDKYILQIIIVAVDINKPVLRCLLRWLQSTDLELYEQAKKQVVDSSPLIVKF